MNNTLPRSATPGQCIEFIFPCFDSVRLCVSEIQARRIFGFDLVSGKEMMLRINSDHTVISEYNSQASSVGILTSTEVRSYLKRRPVELDAEAEKYRTTSQRIENTAKSYRAKISEILKGLEKADAA